MPALPIPELSRRKMDKRLGRASWRQQDLPCRSLFRQLMGLTNLRKRKSLGDRNDKFTACYLLGKLFQARRIGGCPHLTDLNLAAISRLRFADDRGQNSIPFDVRNQPINQIAPDGICDRIQILQATEILVHGDDLVYAQLFRFGPLASANPSNYVSSMLFGYVDRSAPHTPQGTGNQHPLTRARSYSQLNQLRASLQHQGQNAGLDGVEPIRYMCQVFCFASDILRVCMVGHRHHKGIHFYPGNTLAQSYHLTCKVIPQDGRELKGHDVFHVSAPYLVVNGIDAGGREFHQHFAGAGDRDWDFLVDKLVNAPIAMQQYCLHRLPSTDIMLRRWGTM